MKLTKTTLLISVSSVVGLLVMMNHNLAKAFPFYPGNPNSGSTACYHNGKFDGMVYGGTSCPLPPAIHPDHCNTYEPCVSNKHTLEDCEISEVPFND